MTNETLSLAEYQAAAEIVRDRTQQKPEVGLVLGSGLGSLADEILDRVVIPYAEIPHFAVSTVEGHSGQLVIGRLAGQVVVAMQGRVHFYEGYSIHRVTVPVRVMQLLGVETLILTNAAGGINPDFRGGDLMLIVDHINLPGMTGANPLRGPNLDELGPRFSDMVQVYDYTLQTLARDVARQQEIGLQEGVYCFLGGPSFETPAEIRFLRAIGADAVGMSTVPEATVARHGGIRVLGISGITNEAIAHPTPDRHTTHSEVLETGQIVVPKLKALIKGVLQQLPPV